MLIPALQRLQSTVRFLAIGLGILITVTVPAGLGLQSYSDASKHRMFQARLAAERIVQYANIQGPAWTFSAARVAEIVAFVLLPGDTANLTVTDTSGDENSLVIASGTRPRGPILTVHAPIISHMQPVGTVIIEASLLPLISEVLLLAILGALLGASVYVCVHLLPLHALRHATTALSASERNLRAEMKKTEDALQAARTEQRRVELANRTKSEFLANMSHELRTPLNAIIGFSDMMRRQMFGKLPDRYSSYIDDIHASSIHLLDVINDLLDISKIEAGHIDLSIEPIRLDGIFDGCSRFVRERAASAGVQLTIDREEAGAITLAVDEVKTKQILLNLLSNAVKFTPEGTVSMRARAVDMAWAEIDVADTGIGMTAAEIKVALEPFRQVDSSLGRKYSGTGLGLPLAKTLAELHGGTLHVTSAPGAGTTVTVRLPRCDVAVRNLPSHLTARAAE